MRNLRLQFEDENYPVWIGVQCLEEIVTKLRDLDATNYHFVTDQVVEELHARVLCEKLSQKNTVRVWQVDAGELNKSLQTVEKITQQMVRCGIDRRSVIVAIGGGLVGNLAGLMSALLFRGVRLVHIPTTLIAAADSVASLKQAVNLPNGKNLLGCFHTPTAVFIDVDYLQTLPETQIRSGMCEIIKNALAVSSENIGGLEKTLRDDAKYSNTELMEIVESGLVAKQKVMGLDKFERADGLVFEYGHTVGHAIELAAKGLIPHGQAVGLGMIVSAEISHRLGRLSSADRHTHYALLKRNRLVIQLPKGVTVSAVIAMVKADNKRGYVSGPEDSVAMILLDALGSPAVLNNRPLVHVDINLVRECIEHCLNTHGHVEV